MTIKHTECRQSHMLFNRNSWRILNITCSQLTNISFLFIKKQMTAEFIPTLLKNFDWNSNRCYDEKSSWALTLNQNSLIQEKRKKKSMWIEVENVWLTDAQRWADRSLLSNFVWAIRCALPNSVTTTRCMHIRVHTF